MADELAALEDWAAPLLARLEPAARRALAATIGHELWRSQTQRIAAQRNPDGSAYEPRKPQRARVRAKTGKVRTKMFERLPAAKHLRLQSNPKAASIGFLGRAERIARVHQFGERDRVQDGGPDHTYAARELLGFTDEERDRIKELLLGHLSS